MNKMQNIFLAAVLVAAFAIALLSSCAHPAADPSTAPEPTVAPTETAPTEAASFVNLALSEYRVLLSWQPIEGAESYRISCDDGSGMTELGTTKKASFRKKGLKGGTAYTFEIRGVRKQDGKETAVGKTLTVSGRTLPDTPVVKGKRSGDTCTLSWKEVANADEYTVETSSDGVTWYSEGTTTELEYTFTADEADVFAAVRAVIHTSDGDDISDYAKTYLTKNKRVGKMISFGDSVAVGVGSHSYSYADIFAEEHQLTLVDKSNSGAQISADNPDKKHIGEMIQKDVTSEYEYVFIEGGNNDHYFNSPLGEVTSEWSDSFDTKTTCGALESALSYLRDNCPDSKVVFILIHRREESKNDLGLTFEDYAKAIRSVCKKYDVPVADCLKNGELDASDPEMCSEYTFHFNGVFPDGDGVHPSEEAYRKFYLPLIEKALKK